MFRLSCLKSFRGSIPMGGEIFRQISLFLMAGGCVDGLSGRLSLSCGWFGTS